MASNNKFGKAPAKDAKEDVQGEGDNVEIKEGERVAFGERGGLDENMPLNKEEVREGPKAQADAQNQATEEAAEAQDEINMTLAGVPDEASDGVVARYTSHPTQRLRIGEHQFENGLLEFTDSDKLDNFKKQMEGMPASVRSRVQEISVERAEKVAADFRKQGTRMTSGMDTSRPSKADD